MADVALLAGGTVEAPLEYTIPGAQEIIPKSATATFDGSGAAGSFVPTLQIIAPNGTVLASCPIATTLAAGASADVSWFPRVGGGGNGSGTDPNAVHFNDPNDELLTRFLTLIANASTVADDGGHYAINLESQNPGGGPSNHFGIRLLSAFVLNLIGTTSVFLHGIGGPEFTAAGSADGEAFFFDLFNGAFTFQIRGAGAVPIVQVTGLNEISLYPGTTPVGQPAAIPPPAGGATIDTQARAAIVSILDVIGAAAGGIGVTA